MPQRAVEIMGRNGISVRVLEAGERYYDASNTLQRLGAEVDEWPSIPAGMFIVEERTLYLRITTPMTIAHELGHALDCALGGGVYRSSYDADVRNAQVAREFVTPYAAVSIDEYFARRFERTSRSTNPTVRGPR